MAEPVTGDDLATIIDLAARNPRRRQVFTDTHLVTHTVTSERRLTIRRKTMWNAQEVTQHRFVCSCGYVTGWHLRWIQARKKMDRHALSGQLQLPNV